MAEDFQFQFIGENNTATLKGTYVKENRFGSMPPTLRARPNNSDWLSYATVGFDLLVEEAPGFNDQ